MKQANKLLKITVPAAFLLYLAVMLYLLFFRRIGRTSPLSYWELVEISVNFVPFRTIGEFWQNMGSDRAFLVWQAVKNLAGNIILFIPIGLFLPYFWEKQRKLRWFLLTVTLAIICVELIQLFTLLGACDVDDLIFNVGGACLGFLCFSVCRRILIKRGNKSK